MKNVLIRIQQYAPGASEAEKGVIDFIKRSPESAAGMNIHELASCSFSSASTIVRLCRKLGFEGYRDLQSSLVYELAIRKQTSIENEQRIDKSGELSEIISSITYRNMSSLEDTLKLLEGDSVKRAVDIIERCDTVYLFGLGASQIVAQDAWLKFLRVDKPCACTNDIHSQMLFARNAGRNDAAIIISYSGVTEEILACAEELKANNVPIIAITRFESSPLAQMATCCLYVVAREEIFRSGAMSSRIAQLNIIDILYTAYINRSFDENLKRLEHNIIRKDGMS